MQRIKVSEEVVISTLREVAAGRPDYVYERPEGGSYCLYVHGDQPGCIVGHVLNRLGVPLAELEKREGRGAFVVAAEFLHTTGFAREVLDVAQALQDRGRTWGESVGHVA